MNTIAERGVSKSARSPCAEPALEIAGLQAWYGESHILHGVDLMVHRGEVVTLLGRNGAGRTTTLRAIMGLPAGARARFGGRTRNHRHADPPIAHCGIGYCPEDAAFFQASPAKKT